MGELSHSSVERIDLASTTEALWLVAIDANAHEIAF